MGKPYYGYLGIVSVGNRDAHYFPPLEKAVWTDEASDLSDNV